jgi:anti-sigma B factor antagonist
MKLVSKTVDDILVVGLAEPDALEASNVEDFRNAMANILGNVRRVLLDLGNVTFLDSSGMGALIAIWRKVSINDGEIKLCRIGPSVRTLFEIIRIHRILELYDTEEEAIASYEKRSSDHP